MNKFEATLYWLDKITKWLIVITAIVAYPFIALMYGEAKKGIRS